MSISTSSFNQFLVLFFFSVLLFSTGSSLNKRNSQGFLSLQTSSDGYSDGSSSSSQDSTVQIITVSRHGTSTQVGKPFVVNEWAPYKISSKDIFEHEVLTILGAGQCWSLGKNLNIKYPKVMNSTVFNRGVGQFHLFPEQKSIKCAHFLEYGIRGIVPDIGRFSDDIVKSAFDKHGNCPLCFSDSAFPFDETQEAASQSLNDGNGSELSDEVFGIDSIFSDHPQKFLDWYDSCTGIHGVISYKSCKGFSTEDRKRLFIDPGQEVYLGTHTLYGASKHFYHGLPNFGLSKFAENTLKKDWDFADGDMRAFLKGTIMISYVHGLSLLKKIYNQLENGKTWIGYFVHNNNLAALLVLLLGKDRTDDEYYPYYASTVELVLKKNSNGNNYVVLIKDNIVLNMKNCQKECPYEDFRAIIEDILSHEDDAVAFCS